MPVLLQRSCFAGRLRLHKLCITIVWHGEVDEIGPAFIRHQFALLFVEDEGYLLAAADQIDRQFFASIVTKLHEAAALVAEWILEELAQTALAKGQMCSTRVAVDFDVHSVFLHSAKYVAAPGRARCIAPFTHADAAFTSDKHRSFDRQSPRLNA